MLGNGGRREIETPAGVTPCRQSPAKADTSEITFSGSLWYLLLLAAQKQGVTAVVGEGIINCGNGEGTLRKEMQDLGRK